MCLCVCLSVAKLYKQRAAIAKEMLDTEEKYVADLELVIEVRSVV